MRATDKLIFKLTQDVSYNSEEGLLCIQANVTGRSAKTVREYLEKNYSPEAVSNRDGTIMLAIKALLEVVQSGSKFMELAVMEKGKPLEVYTYAGSTGTSFESTSPFVVSGSRTDRKLRPANQQIKGGRNGTKEKQKAGHYFSSCSNFMSY